MQGLQKEMWSDEATMTSERVTFYLEYHSSSGHFGKVTGTDVYCERIEKTAPVSDNAFMLETLAAYVNRRTQVGACKTRRGKFEGDLAVAHFLLLFTETPSWDFYSSM